MGNERTLDIRYLATDFPYLDKPTKVLCPFHEDHNPSLYIYPDHTYCYTCGAHETADQFIQRLGVDPSKIPKRQHSTTQLKRVASRKHNSDVETMVGVWHRTLMLGRRQYRKAWYYDRGIWESTIKRFQLGHTGDRFSIPLWNGNRITSYQLRRDDQYCDPEDIRYLSETGGNESLWYTHGNMPLVIVEGPLDAILVAQYGYATVTTIRGAAQLANELRAFHFPPRTVIAVDQDLAGRRAETDLQLLVPKAKVARWEVKDITEHLMLFPAIERGSVLRDLVGG